MTPVEVTSRPQVKVTTPLRKVASVKGKGGKGKSPLNGVIVHCTKAKVRKGKLKVRALSMGFNST